MTFDYIVVGSGAGGGPLACNLAKAGFSVGLIEAGRDPAKRDDGSPNYNYLVPALHGQATEDPDLAWNFFVRHYANDQRQAGNTKFNDGRDPQNPAAPADPLRTGVLYPRAGTLGGCTAHNAMITVYPHNEDWEFIRQLTGDDSWGAERMRSYFQKLEDCRYAPAAPNEGRHGFGGWLPTSLADPFIAANDRQLIEVALAAVRGFLERLVQNEVSLSEEQKLQKLIGALGPHIDMARSLLPRLPQKLQPLLAASVGKLEQLRSATEHPELLHTIASGAAIAGAAGLELNDAVGFLMHAVSIENLIPILIRNIDPNDWRVAVTNLQGIFATPLATNGTFRRGPREQILNVQAEFPNRLSILQETLVTRVLFEGDRAVGVEAIQGSYLYGASPRANLAAPAPQPVTLSARKEVILCGGTYNTPQLLMLSGIGPQAVLNAQGIAPLLNRPWEGVGKNLQDRYEIAVVSEMKDPFSVLNAPFKRPAPGGPPDPTFDQWQQEGSGAYTTNGVVLGIVLRSRQAETPAPDLFIFGLPGSFKGYYPQYAQQLTTKRNAFTWAILKGHTRNHAGEVTLRSPDPRVPPHIQFNYFDTGSPGHQQDLDALLEAVGFVNGVMDRTGMARTTTLLPNVPLDNATQLGAFVQNEAWGHHACGTCAIGPASDPQAVVDSRFRVHGVKGLRIVDASVFPKIPGFFIVTPIYMISEKASEVIIADANA